ncbi:MAG: GNAT family N-acetyltransferase [Alphaproteobacteria bacterium]
MTVTLKHIEEIKPEHHAQILKMNTEFVHWLAPLSEMGLIHLLGLATYKKQIGEASAILIGYPHDVDYPDHWNLSWLNQNFDNYFYIDRIIVGTAAQGQALGRRLYTDIADFARTRGYARLCCEVNIIPDNPASHKFHRQQGFTPCGEQTHMTEDKAVRYYTKAL